MLALTRGFVRVALALCIAGAVLPGCARKAPGPQECAQFAAAVVLQHAPSNVMTLEMQAQIEEETRNCLTRPYDRELINCVLSTSRGRACLEMFRRRSGRIVTPAVEPG